MIGTPSPYSAMMRQRAQQRGLVQDWQTRQQSWQNQIAQALMQNGVAPDIAQQASQNTTMLHSIAPDFFRWFNSRALGPAA
jgi:hypothetical protein